MSDVLEMARKRRDRLQAEIDRQQAEIGRLNAFLRFAEVLQQGEGAAEPKPTPAAPELAEPAARGFLRPNPGPSVANGHG